MSIDFSASDEDFLRQVYCSEHYTYPLVAELYRRMSDLLGELESANKRIDEA